LKNILEIFSIAAQAWTDIEFDNLSSEKVKELRKESVSRLLPFILEYNRQGFLWGLVKTIFEKKIGFVMTATTKQEMDEIIKPSLPFYNYAAFVPKGSYHVEEEELILWSIASLQSVLKPEATERFKYLFKKLTTEEGVCI